jgi:uncharacterized membrane protein HdeD (DUF308 family)
VNLKEKISLIVTGLVYLAIGVLVLLYPKLINYGVAAAFLIHGVSSLVRAWERRER